MEPYVKRAESSTIKIRWISVQCYEIKLPNGKTIVTDPFYWDVDDFKRTAPENLNKEFQMVRDVYTQSGFSVDSFEGADYIILNHVHGDHANIVGKLWDKFRGRVLVPAEAAEELARVYDIPYGAVYPLYPGNTYYFGDFDDKDNYVEDFVLKTYPGCHDSRAFREGFFTRPSDPTDKTAASDIFGIPCPNRTNGLGSMFNFNFLIETTNNYRIDFSAGRDYEEHAHHVAMAERPNLMLRHRIRSYSPEYTAKQIQTMGAQIYMPLHHTNARASNEDLNAYFLKVNEILKSRGSTAVAVNPEPYKWYSIFTSIIGE